LRDERKTSTTIPKILIAKIMSKMFKQITSSTECEMSNEMQQIFCVLSQLNITIEKDENNEFVYEYELNKVA
jgi:hypothetical protein